MSKRSAGGSFLKSLWRNIHAGFKLAVFRRVWLTGFRGAFDRAAGLFVLSAAPHFLADFSSEPKISAPEPILHKLAALEERLAARAASLPVVPAMARDAASGKPVSGRETGSCGSKAC